MVIRESTAHMAAIETLVDGTDTGWVFPWTIADAGEIRWASTNYRPTQYGYKQCFTCPLVNLWVSPEIRGFSDLVLHVMWPDRQSASEPIMPGFNILHPYSPQTAIVDKLSCLASIKGIIAGNTSLSGSLMGNESQLRTVLVE